MDLKQVLAIASLFHLPEPIEVYHFPEKGNINRETYLVAAGPQTECAEYILQQLNPGVFKKPADIMRAMISSKRRGVGSPPVDPDQSGHGIPRDNLRR